MSRRSDRLIFTKYIVWTSGPTKTQTDFSFSRRPLLGYRLDLRIERDLGHVEGRRVEKCRRNEILCMTGLTLLIVLWLLTIYSADYKDDVVIGR